MVQCIFFFCIRSTQVCDLQSQFRHHPWRSHRYHLLLPHNSLTPLRCGLTVFGGQEDPRYSREQLEAWCSLARQDCRVHWVKGGHLFVRDQQEDVLALLTTELQTIWPV